MVMNEEIPSELPEGLGEDPHERSLRCGIDMERGIIILIVSGKEYVLAAEHGLSLGHNLVGKAMQLLGLLPPPEEPPEETGERSVILP